MEPRTYLPYPVREESNKFLMALCYNVSISNYQTTSLPVPDGFEVVELMGNTLYKIKRMIGYLFRDKKRRKSILVFTGTEFPDEWIADLNFHQVRPEELDNYQPGVWCHEGFYEMYLSVRDQIRGLLNETVDLEITGHSLGGALATIAAYDLAKERPWVTTFGAPRVFDPTGATLLDKTVNFTRIFNTEDVVPTVPLPITGSVIYQHVGINEPFTTQLGTTAKNHVDAYVNYVNE